MNVMRHIVLPLGVACIAFAGCAKTPDLVRSETLTRPMLLGLGNFVVIDIHPNGSRVEMTWNGYNRTNRNAFNPPFETLVLHSGSERYVISDETSGNNAISVNGRELHFDASTKQVHIQFGKGVTIIDGGEYATARKIYDESGSSKSK